MQPHSQERATLSLPPEFPVDYWPCDLYAVEEMNVVRDFLRATLRCRGPEEFEKATKGWKPEARSEIARVLGDLRERGFYPERIDESGSIVWGVRLKSAVQIRLDRYAEYWLQRGEQLDSELGGSLARIMSKLRNQN